jgi:hypothetical protein
MHLILKEMTHSLLLLHRFPLIHHRMQLLQLIVGITNLMTRHNNISLPFLPLSIPHLLRLITSIPVLALSKFRLTFREIF